MNKNLFLAVIALFLSVSVFAQEGRVKVEQINKSKAEGVSEGWTKGGEGLINLSNTSFKQWAEGGTNATAVTGSLGVFANLKQGKILWENGLKLGLGFLSQSQLVKDQFKKDNFRKSEDFIHLTSKLGYELKPEKLYWATILEANTQLLNTKNYSLDTVKGVIPEFLSRSLSPLTLKIGTGLDYRPTPKLSIYYSPLTYIGLFVKDQTIANLGIFGNKGSETDTSDLIILNPNSSNGFNFSPKTLGEKSRHELGSYLKVSYKEPKFILDNLSLESTLELFANYLDNPQNIDVAWANSLGLKVNKYIGAKLEYTLKYDDNIDVNRGDKGFGPGLQSKTFIGVGFNYKF